METRGDEIDRADAIRAVAVQLQPMSVTVGEGGRARGAGLPPRGHGAVALARGAGGRSPSGEADESTSSSGTEEESVCQRSPEGTPAVVDEVREKARAQLPVLSLSRGPPSLLMPRVQGQEEERRPSARTRPHMQTWCLDVQGEAKAVQGQEEERRPSARTRPHMQTWCLDVQGEAKAVQGRSGRRGVRRIHRVCVGNSGATSAPPRRGIAELRAVQLLFARPGVDRHVWILHGALRPSSSRSLVGGAARAAGRNVGPGVQVLRLVRI